MLTPVLSVAADRIGFYAVPLQMMVLTRAAALAAGRAAPDRRAGRDRLPGLAMFAAWMALTSYRTCLSPYRSYLTDPGALRTADPEVHRRPFLCMQGQVCATGRRLVASARAARAALLSFRCNNSAKSRRFRPRRSDCDSPSRPGSAQAVPH